jgi:sugar lactone lactonase YvrE
MPTILTRQDQTSGAGGIATSLLQVVAISALLISAAVAFQRPARASSPSFQTITTFNRSGGETPENLVIGPNGTIYLSLAFAGEVIRLSKDGERALVTVPTDGGLTVGITSDLQHGGDLDVAVKSPNASDAGIWRVPLAAFDDPSVHPTRLAALPTSAFPNGIQFDDQGNLLIADSDLGTIWRLSPGSSTASVWAQSPLLDPTGAAYMGFPLPGANGLQLRNGVVFVSNTATNEILAIQIQPDGLAGAVTVRYHVDAPDDFAISPKGNFYVAQNVPSELSLITPDGRVSTLATSADGLANTSAARFGATPSTQSLLYITNSGYFTGSPSLMVTRIDGAAGPRLPSVSYFGS